MERKADTVIGLDVGVAPEGTECLDGRGPEYILVEASSRGSTKEGAQPEDPLQSQQANMSSNRHTSPQ